MGTYPLALVDTILCLPMIFANLMYSVNGAIRVRAKTSNGTTVGTASNFNCLCGH